MKHFHIHLWKTFKFKHNDINTAKLRKCRCGLRQWTWNTFGFLSVNNWVEISQKEFDERLKK